MDQLFVSDGTSLPRSLSFEMVQRFFEVSLDLIAVVDRQGHLLYINPAWERTLGWKREDILSRPFLELIHPDDLWETRKAFRQVLEGRDLPYFENRYLAKDGTYHTLIWTTPALDPGEQWIYASARDRTDRSRINALLRESEERYRIVVENTGQLIYDYNVATGGITWTGAIELITGHTPEEFSPMDITQWENSIHPNDREAALQLLDEAMAGKFNYCVQYRFRHKNGHYIHVEDNGIFLYNAAGNAYRMLGTMKDISIERQFELSLRESRTRLSAIIDTAMDAIITVDEHLRISIFNHAAESMLRCPVARALGATIDMFIPPRLMLRYYALLRAFLRSSERHLSIGADGGIMAQRFDGEEFPVEASVSRVSINGKDLYTVILRDLSERLHTQRALRDNEAKYRTLAETSPAGIWHIDRSGRTIYMNPAMREMLELDTADDSAHITADAFLPEESLMRIQDGMSLQNDVPYASCEVELTGRRGTRRHTILSGAPLIDQTGASVGLICTIVDNTQRKVAEERLRGSLHEKEVLLREIHHRVKNNLQIISSLLNLQSAQLGDPNTRELFHDSQNRIRSMALIHEQLYNTDDLAKINVAEYFRQLTSNLWRSYNAHALRLELCMDIDPVHVDIDTAIPCGLIVNELISNAMKYAFPDGRRGSITVTFRYSGGRYRLAITDNGIGLPDTVDVTAAGTLGLQLVDTLTNQLDGRLEIIRTDGTTFAITFPVDQPV